MSALNERLKDMEDRARSREAGLLGRLEDLERQVKAIAERMEAFEPEDAERVRRDWVAVAWPKE